MILKILVAEDNKFFRRLIEVNLTQWGHEVMGCANGAQALKALTDPEGPKLAIMDWEMPEMEGVEVCREVRKVKDKPYIYIIMLTAKSLKEDVILGLESGADDYITKPFDPLELKVRVRAATRIVELQEDLLRAVEASEIRAKEDSLTGLWNHSAIVHILEAELDRARRQRTAVGVIIADVDKFKQINDAHGHLVGDSVIKGVSRIFREGVRSYDHVGRYGGDELLVVCPNCDAEETRKLADRLCGSVSEFFKARYGGHIDCTVSFGVTAYSGLRKQSLKSIVKAADMALYKAKASGRNQVTTEIPSRGEEELNTVDLLKVVD